MSTSCHDQIQTVLLALRLYDQGRISAPILTREVLELNNCSSHSIDSLMKTYRSKLGAEVLARTRLYDTTPADRNQLEQGLVELRAQTRATLLRELGFIDRVRYYCNW